MKVLNEEPRHFLCVVAVRRMPDALKKRDEQRVVLTEQYVPVDFPQARAG